MKTVICSALFALSLSGCVAETLVQGLSLKGKPLATVEKHYGKPTHESLGPRENVYVWDDGPCAMTVTTGPNLRVTDVKMVGHTQACLRLRHRKT